MQVTVSDEYSGGHYVATDEEFTLNGDFRKNPATGKVTSFSGSVDITDGEHIGNVSGYWNGDKLRYNLNDIEIEYLADIAAAVVALVTELEK